MCVDGIVLGTDLQYTIDSTKTPGQKIFSLCPGERFSVLIAGAVSADSAKQLADIAQDSLLGKYRGTVPTLRQIKTCIEESLRVLYREHIDIAPASERRWMEVQLLVGIHSGMEMDMFYSHRTRLIRETHAKCLGIGLYFSNYALASLLAFTIHVEEAAPIVAYVISMAKNYVEGVGHGSDVHMLYENGEHDSLLKHECDEIERGFRSFMEAIPHIVASTNSETSPDDYLEGRFVALKEGFKQMRDTSTKMRERRRAQPRFFHPTPAPIS
jgi:hypothetical protein